MTSGEGRSSEDRRLRMSRFDPSLSFATPGSVRGVLSNVHPYRVNRPVLCVRGRARKLTLHSWALTAEFSSRRSYGKLGVGHKTSQLSGRVRVG